ncbi:TPA: hypothetical protein ACXNDR_003051 [Serratia marcescens]
MQFKNIFIHKLKSEGATLFRRRYETNGCHAGYVYYIGDSADCECDDMKIAEAMLFRISEGVRVTVYGKPEVIACDMVLQDGVENRQNANLAKDFGDAPFIHPGNLTKDELFEWLGKVTTAVNQLERYPVVSRRLNEQLAENAKVKCEQVEFLNNVLTQPLRENLASELTPSETKTDGCEKNMMTVEETIFRKKYGQSQLSDD